MQIVKLRKGKVEQENSGDQSPNPLTKFAVPFIHPQSAALSKAPLSKVKCLEKESIGVLFPGLRQHCH